MVLDKHMVPWYIGTMNTIATNIRFPQDEYRDIKLLALSQGKSTAFVIREAVSWYKRKKLTSKVQISIAEKLRKFSVKIDVPVAELIATGRKFA